jgi:CRISPR-associated protein Cas2
MWLFAMFDLPVDTPKARRNYTRFRTALLDEGFSMLQYSVYARYFASEEANAAKRKRIKEILPPDGEVRLLAVTDHQFGKMEVFRGKKLADPEAPPSQLAFF